MRCTLATLALAALAVAKPVPQGVTSAISPSGSAPAGCSPDYSGSFQIQVVKAAAKRSLSPRQSGALVITLSGGVLMDNDGRTGYIAANHQFQFDDPPQTGAIYTAGWSVCGNGSLAIGPNAVFYQCLSGTFYNLYDESTGAQCSPVYIDVIGGGAAAPVPSGGASVMSDGQPTAGPAVTQISDGQIQAPVCTEIVDGQPQCPTAAVTQISDGQIQAPTAAPAAPVTQISDGQIQAPTAAPCTEIVDGQPQCPTVTPAAPVTQISDGQIQAPTAVVTQISDGQIQAPTAAPCTQIVDGQPQCPTATPVAPVTQISDGQIQAPTAVVTQISDGQIQAPSAAPCTQIVDGQPQCPSAPANYTSPPAPSVVPATGAASTFAIGNGVFALAAGVLAVFFL